MIDFYYWGVQCPYNVVNLRILKEIEVELKIEVNYFDISKNPEMATDINLFSPTLIIFDKSFRWTGPINKKIINEYLGGTLKKRKPYIVKSENRIIQGEIRFLTPESAKDVKKLCCPQNCSDEAEIKGNWIKELINEYKLKHVGVLHYIDGVCIGGAEFLPSIAVPYNIPKSTDYAFLTCSYSSDPIYDYKGYPLERLEEELGKMGYTKVFAIASEEVSFPNGPLGWFLEKGYSDLGLVYYEENDAAYQHLIVKKLLET